MKLYWITTLVLGTIGLSSCAAMEPQATTPTLDGSTWVLSSLPGQTLVADAIPTLRFADGRVSGSDGCNRYAMPFTADGSAIEIGPQGPSTLMACAGETMTQAGTFIAALISARGFRYDAATLDLVDGDGVVVATLTAQAKSLAGVSWRVININNEQAIVGVISDTEVTMEFDDQGRVSGMAGCNRFTAEYLAQGDAMRFSNVAATRMACPDPAIMDQEKAFLRALEWVTTLRFESNRVDLLRKDGSIAIILVRNL